MKLKRFAIILLAVAIFASVLAVSASAAEIQPYNNVDQAYSFNFNGSWWQDDLHQYWKENSTSVYIYSKAFADNVLPVHIIGAAVENGLFLGAYISGSHQLLEQGEDEFRFLNQRISLVAIGFVHIHGI